MRARPELSSAAALSCELAHLELQTGRERAETSLQWWVAPAVTDRAHWTLPHARHRTGYRTAQRCTSVLGVSVSPAAYLSAIRLETSRFIYYTMKTPTMTEDVASDDRAEEDNATTRARGAGERRERGGARSVQGS